MPFSPSQMPLPQQATLFYDEQCSMCRALVGYIARTDRSQSIALKPLKGETGQGMRLIWIDGSGLAHEAFGSACLPELLKRLPGWQLLAPVFELPGIPWLAAMAYRRIAHNRYRISTIIEKLNPEMACNEGHCKL